MIQGLRFCFLAVPVLWVAAAHIGPLLAMASISFLDVYPGPPNATPAVGLAAYTLFLHEAGYRASLLRSLGLAAAATLASLLLTYPLAYHVALRVAPKRRSVRLLLLVAPFWTSEVLRMFALVLLLANRGALNGLLRWIGLTDAPAAVAVRQRRRAGGHRLHRAAVHAAAALRGAGPAAAPVGRRLHARRGGVARGSGG